MVDRKGILARLKEIIDPELGINIVDLGLIYEVGVSRAEGAAGSPRPKTASKAETMKAAKASPLAHVEIKMTLTSVGCPLAGYFAMQVEQKVKEMKGVKDVHVHVVWDPPWTIDKMSREARLAMGIPEKQ